MENNLRILALHDTPTRQTEKGYEMLERYTLKGEYYEEWIPVPRTTGELLRWLGY